MVPYDRKDGIEKTSFSSQYYGKKVISEIKGPKTAARRLSLPAHEEEAGGGRSHLFFLTIDIIWN